MRIALIAFTGVLAGLAVGLPGGSAAAQSRAINVAVQNVAVQQDATDRGSQQRASEQVYCETLSDQYDRYSRYIDVPSLGRSAWLDGTERCQQGKFADGEQLIIEAIREIGFAPLSRSALADRATQP